jgi:hypothetical protein
VEFGDVPSDGELLALPSGAGWPVMKTLLVTEAWCWWSLRKIFLSLSENKLEEVARALDLGFGVMAAVAVDLATADAEVTLPSPVIVVVAEGRLRCAMFVSGRCIRSSGVCRLLVGGISWRRCRRI